MTPKEKAVGSSDTREPSQRGFVLIIILLLLIVMATVSGSVLLATQADLQVSTTDREARVAFYAAEAGVASAKDFLISQSSGTGAGAWTRFIGSGNVQLCARGTGASPGTQALTSTPTTDFDPARLATFRWCAHNNALDPAYFEVTPAGDAVDGDGVVTIESWGTGPAGARTHLTVDVAASGGAANPVTDYFQAAGDGRKSATGESVAPTLARVVF